MRAPRAVLGPVKRGVTDTPRREGSGEARVSHHPLACPRYFTHYTGAVVLLESCNWHPGPPHN